MNSSKQGLEALLKEGMGSEASRGSRTSSDKEEGRKDRDKIRVERYLKNLKSSLEEEGGLEGLRGKGLLSNQ